MRKLIDKIGNMDVRDVIALISVLAIVGLLFVLCFFPIPTPNSELLYLAVGQVLGTGFGAVMAFFFGASKADVSAKPKSN